MSTPRGIFDTFPNQTPPPGAPPNSPFGFAPESKSATVPSPFTPAPAARKESSFSIVEGGVTTVDEKTIRLPERRKSSDSPFQISEPQGFGFEAPAQEVPQALRATILEQSAPEPPPSPFQMASPPFAPAANSFGSWPQAEVAPAPQAFIPAPQQPAPAPQPVYTSAETAASDSYSIKQIELRAIFGVDREMTKEEIIQRSRSLPGIRQIAPVSERDIAAVDALKQVIANLGFGGGALKLYSGSVPIEFIREGNILLAVQTDGGFAPGVRETLMLVARELGK